MKRKPLSPMQAEILDYIKQFMRDEDEQTEVCKDKQFKLDRTPNQAEIARGMDKPESTISRALDKMELKGWVRRNEDDKRQTRIELIPEDGDA